MAERCDPPVPGARERILTATRDLAAERGPTHVTIQAVAARAGLSKGGVLYHFRTKADLLAALVSTHVDVAQERIDRYVQPDGPNALARALIAARREERKAPAPSAPGVLMVLAEHPDFLDPVRAHLQQALDRLRRESADPELAAVTFLAIEGLRMLSLFGFDLFDSAGEEAVLERMTALLLASESGEA